MIGTTLSHYNILDQLGRGGMGIVYKAHDTKLDRVVAIKVLPSAALASEDDRARFYREAKAAAQLHHPHIASVFEIDEAVPDGSGADEVRPFISMEFIEGDTLADRIASGPLRLQEAIRIGSEIASALESAHKKDIVHRDIKSQNVMLSEEGAAKVLDFGLAQTAQSTKLTRMGSTLGTVAYMSPEQARGEEVDQRTDIWSLGVVLYEMIVGTHPFPGDYEQAAVYSILNEDPEPITGLRTGIPMSLEWIVTKCLAKKREQRYQSARELIVDLGAIDLSSGTHSRVSSASHMTAQMPAPDSSSAPKGVSRSLVLTGIGALFLALISFVLGRSLDASSSTDEQNNTATRTKLVLPDEYPMAFIGNAPLNYGRTALALSKDGSMLAYVADVGEGETHLVLRRMDEYGYRVIEGTSGAYGPFFSPDGAKVAFFADETLKVVPLSGGSVTTVAEARNPTGGTWVNDDQIILAVNEGNRLLRVSLFNGEVEDASPTRTYQPSLLADTDRILTGSNTGLLSVLGFDVEDVTHLAVGKTDERISSPRFLPSGHLIYNQGPQIVATPFDAGSEEIVGASVPIVQGVRVEAIEEAGQYALSDNGTLVYAEGGNVKIGNMYAVNETGSRVLDEFSSGIFGEMRVSPDGKQLALCVLGASWDIWIYQIDGSAQPRRLTRNDGFDYRPVWSPDGSQIYFTSDRNGDVQTFVMSSSTSGNAKPLSYFPEGTVVRAISPDSEWALVDERSVDGSSNIVAYSLTDTTRSITIVSTEHGSWNGSFSPNGDHVVFQSDESGRYEIYVAEFVEGSTPVQVSFSGGMDPIWASDGRSIHYNYVTDVYKVEVSGDEDLSFGQPELVLSGEFLDLGGKGFAYDEINNSYFLAKSVETDQVARSLNVVTNWDEEVKRLAPPNN